MPRLRAYIEAASPAQLFWIVFSVSVLIRLALFFLLNRIDVMRRSELENIALSLLRNGSFADPYAIPTGPTAHASPVYPFLLSLLYRLAGTGMLAEWLEEGITTLFVAVTFGLLPYLSKQLFQLASPGFIGGLLAALSPACFITETKGKEAPFAALVFLLCWLLTIHIMKRAQLTQKDAVSCGFAWGFMLLTYPGMLLTLLGWLVVPGYRLFHKQTIPYFRFPATVGMCAIAVLIPWTIRNYLTFGHLFFIRDNVGLELAVGQNDEATPYVLPEPPPRDARHPYGVRSEAEFVARVGEFEYHQARKTEATAWMKAHPQLVIEMTLKRVGAFWLSLNEKLYRQAPHTVIRLSALLGAILWFTKYRVVVETMLVFWIMYPIPYYFTQYHSRYSYLLEWSLALMAGAFVSYLLSRSEVMSGASAHSTVQQNQRGPAFRLR